MSTLDIEATIRRSDWWRRAAATPDRHGNLSSGVSLTDHLDAVLGNVRWLLVDEPVDDFTLQVRQRLESMGIDILQTFQTLLPVALLHDLGKLSQDKNATVPHPLTGKPAAKRHPVASVLLAMELLPASLENRDRILALIDKHATPFAWYVQYRKSGSIPGPKAWVHLDRKLNPKADGSGLVLLALFKIADIAGHESSEDVAWFVSCANDKLLANRNRDLPVPSTTALKSRSRARGDGVG